MPRTLPWYKKYGYVRWGNLAKCIYISQFTLLGSLFRIAHPQCQLLTQAFLPLRLGLWAYSHCLFHVQVSVALELTTKTTSVTATNYWAVTVCQASCYALYLIEIKAVFLLLSKANPSIYALDSISSCFLFLGLSFSNRSPQLTYEHVLEFSIF